MEVGDGFTGVGAVVDYQAEATGEVEFFGDHARCHEEVAEEGGVGWRGVGCARDDALGHDEEVERRLGLDVVNDDAFVVLMLDFRWNLSVDDALEYGFAHG